jgi:hypothetical protein
MTLRNTEMSTEIPSKKSCKKSLRISWRRYKIWLTKVDKMHSRNFKHQNKEYEKSQKLINEIIGALNTKVK